MKNIRALAPDTDFLQDAKDVAQALVVMGAIPAAARLQAAVLRVVDAVNSCPAPPPVVPTPQPPKDMLVASDAPHRPDADAAAVGADGAVWKPIDVAQWRLPCL